MLTSYNLSAKNLRLDGLNVDANNAFGTDHNQETISLGSSLSVYGKQSFQDPMDFGWSGWSGVNTSRSEKIMRLFNDIGGYTNGLSTSVFPSYAAVGIGTTNPGFGRLGWNRDIDNLGYDNIRRWRDHISKAMVISLLDGNGKRTTSIGSSTLTEKVETFFNILQDNDPKHRDPGISTIVNLESKPWDTWYDSHSTLTISSISRSNNIATVTTSSSHGLSDSYDDWGVVITLNSSNISDSFNISTSTYPNGVPIKITGSDTFHYKSVGFNTATTATNGTADIRVGFGGTSNDLHFYIT